MEVKAKSPDYCGKRPTKTPKYLPMMEEAKNNKGKHNLFDLKHLNKSKVIWLSVLWVLAVICCLIYMSDFFSRSVFTRKSFTLWVILLASGYTMIKIHRTYNRQKRGEEIS